MTFLGAGFSRGATNVKGNEPRLGSQLAEFLAARSGMPKSTPLEDAAESFQRKFGAFELVNELKKEYTITAVADHQLVLAKVPWMRIYTTNYDNAFEFAAKAVGSVVQTVTTQTDPFTLQQQQTACIHLNGVVSDLSPAALDSTFKLTETSYITASIADSPWAVRLREDARLAHAVFFIGYSLYDLDVKRVLAENPRLREKSFFVVGETPSELLLQRIDRFGLAVSQRAEQFGAHFSEFEKTYTPPVEDAFEPQSCAEIKAITASQGPSDKAVLDLFELGLVDKKALMASLSQGERYYLERRQVSQVLKIFNEGGGRSSPFPPHLGTGSRFFLKLFQCELGKKVIVSSRLARSPRAQGSNSRKFRGCLAKFC